MPASTPLGYPYPLPTEPVAEGAQAIRNLAESLKGWKCLAERDLAASSGIAVPAGFDHLRLIVKARGPAAAKTDLLLLIFNSNTGASYFHSLIQANNGAVTAVQALSQPIMTLGVIPGASATAGFFGFYDLLLTDHAGPNYKTVAGNGYAHAPLANNASDLYTVLVGGTWANAAAITNVDLYCNSGLKAASGSKAWLYGIAGA